MTKYVKGKDGKFAGSIGDGKDNVPTAAPKVSAAERRRLEMNEQVRQINERALANREAYARLREQREAARQAWFSISDSVNSSYPEARWMLLDENYQLVGLTNQDNTIIADGASVIATHPTVQDSLEVFARHEDLVSGRYKRDEGHRVGIFYLCGEDGCTHRYYPEGFQPGHTASRYCRSGRRPHCTCDTCF